MKQIVRKMLASVFGKELDKKAFSISLKLSLLVLYYIHLSQYMSALHRRDSEESRWASVRLCPSKFLFSTI